MYDTDPPRINLADHGIQAGENTAIYAHSIDCGTNVVIGDKVTLVTDRLTIASNVTISSNCDLRASELSIGENTEIHDGVSILVAETCSIGAAGRMAKRVQITCREFVAGNLLYMGDGTTVGYGGTTSSTAFVSIGNRVTIGQHSILNSNCRLEIDDNVGTGSYLAIWTHGYHFGHGPLEGIEPAYSPVHVGKNVWLGFQVTILPGVSVGDNSMVAAGAVITKSMPPNVLIGGVPASIKKDLNLSPIKGIQAFSAVVKVLEAWQKELDWKGCTVSVNTHDDSIYSLDVNGDNDELRVILVNEAAQLPSCEGRCAIITVDQRDDFDLSNEHTLLCLREGSFSGPASPIASDLRDQLRRFAMPCGDTTPFSSIIPVAFSRLKKIGQ